MSTGSKQVRSPYSLIESLIAARQARKIEYAGYVEALKVLERHFEVYDQRLRVMNAPSSFPNGEVLLEAASEGLTKLRESAEELKTFDPLAEPQRASSLLEVAQEGYNLLLQLKEVNAEQQQELEKTYEQLEDLD